MLKPIVQAFKYTQMAASANVRATKGRLGGIFVSAASGSPSITVYDSAATGTTTKIVDTFTPVAATWYPMPFEATAGIYVVIGGTVQCSVATSA